MVSRLKSIKDWLTQDPTLLPLVDRLIGGQVDVAKRRQKAREIMLSLPAIVGDTVSGWLVAHAAGTRTTLQQLAGHCCTALATAAGRAREPHLRPHCAGEDGRATGDNWPLRDAGSSSGRLRGHRLASGFPSPVGEGDRG